jgi:4-hydroxybenzoate polyprenyltransferase
MTAQPPLGLDPHALGQAPANDSALPIDIAVDLDGTLLVGDTLDEGFAKMLFVRPLGAARAIASLIRGRSALKDRVSSYSAASVDHAPARQDFLDWLHAQRDAGRKLHLVTAADHRVAAAVAARFGLFDSVIATRDGVNLKGRRKKDKLVEAFPDGFAYAGDSRADLHVFRAAQSIVLAGASSSVTAAAYKLGKTVEAEFPALETSPFKTWLKALRIHQWAKNFLIFIPLLLGHAFTHVEAVKATLLGFLLMGLVASGTYILNDISDLASDRAHETKRRRAFASGALSVRAGLVAAPALIVGGLSAALFVSPPFAALLALYTVTTVSYSFWLKRVPMLDVSVLAFLYGLRLGAGAILAQVPLSQWLVAFALFFFFSLSLAKRHTEVAKKAQVMTGPIPGRGYHTSDAQLTLPMGVATTACSILIIVLFLVFEAFASGGYSRPNFLWPAPAIIALWTQRIWLLAARGELDDDPVSFAVRDKLSLALGALLFVCAAAAL